LAGEVVEYPRPRYRQLINNPIQVSIGRSRPKHAVDLGNGWPPTTLER